MRRPISRAEAPQHLGQIRPGHGRSAAGEQIERRRRAGQPAVGQMQITHRRGNVGMAQQVLDARQIDAGFEQMGGKRVAQSRGCRTPAKPAAWRAAWKRRCTVFSPIGPEPSRFGNTQQGRQVRQ